MIDDNLTYSYSQKVIKQLLDKNVYFIYNQGEEFFFVCSKDYDEKLTVVSSLNEHFKIKIMRKIEPGIIQLFDVAHSIDNQEMNGFGSKMILFGCRDEEQFYDILNPSQ